MGFRGSETSFSMVVLLAVLLASLFSTVNATIGHRYGPPIRRPVHFFNRPRPAAFPGTLIPSPTHAYSIFARPQQLLPPQLAPQPAPHNVRFPSPPPQQYTPQLNHGFVPMPRPQPLYYPNSQPQRPVPQHFGFQAPTPSQQISYQQPHAAPVYQPSAAANNFYVQTTALASQNPAYAGSSSFNQNSYLPQSHSYLSQQANRPFHFHTKPLYDASGVSQGLSYEPCTSSHWQPVVSSAITPAASSSQPTYFYGGSVSTATVARPPAPAGPAYFRYQPAESNNKVVVLSHDVLKTLLANSKSPQQSSSNSNAAQTGTKGFVDNVASASSTSSNTFITSNHIVQTGASSATIDAFDQPSVKLVGYIGPTSGSTPSGYIQVPISKEMMENLSGSGSNYDFAVNSSSYSLFTLKSVNDVENLFSLTKSNDNEASSSSTLGLVISNSGKTQQGETLKMSGSSSDTIFYPVPSGSSASVSAVASPEGAASSPAIQMVGHVQITSPDISSHFVKRQDTAEVLEATA